MTRTGIIYTETTIYAAPREFVADAPYQLVIVGLDKVTLDDDGSRVTGRVIGNAVRIGDAVELAEERGGVPFFRSVDSPAPA